MMTLEIAKENLFKEKRLSYLEALQTKIELIKNKDDLEVDIENIRIQEIENDMEKVFEELTMEEIDELLNNSN